VAGNVVGVLALQGAFIKHVEMLKGIGVSAVEVRRPADLDRCDRLILPGGESTTMQRQIRFANLETPLREFAAVNPTFGTCAGLILLAQWGLLDIEVERNGYGPQIASCIQDLQVQVPRKRKRSITGVFIRAPRILSTGADVDVLCKAQDEPVLVQQELLLAATFHPELTSDTWIHELFLKMSPNYRLKPARCG